MSIITFKKQSIRPNTYIITFYAAFQASKSNFNCIYWPPVIASEKNRFKILENFRNISSLKKIKIEFNSGP